MASQRPQKKRSKSQTSDQVRRAKVRATPAATAPAAPSPSVEPTPPTPPSTTPMSATRSTDTSVVAEKGGVPVGRGEREQPLSSVELVSLVGALGLILTLMLMVIVAA